MKPKPKPKSQSKHGKSYSKAFKESSVKLAITSGKSVSKIAKKLGIGDKTLYTWIKKYRADKLAKQLADQRAKQDYSLEKEVEQLRRENAKLKREKEALKKALACLIGDADEMGAD